MNQKIQSMSELQTTQKAVWYENFPIVNCLIFFVAIVCLGLHWAVLTFAENQYGDSLLNFVLKETGLAGLVALILNLSIEWVNRKKHNLHQDSLLEKLEIKHQQTSATLLEKLDIKHQQTSSLLLKNVNEHLFKTIYERNIDPTVFRQVEKYLLKADYMRRDYVASFKITRFSKNAKDDAKPLVKLDFYCSYRIFNLTDQPVEVEVAKALIDVTPNYKDSNHFERITLGSEVFSVDDLKKTGEITEVPSRNLLSLLVKRVVPPNDSLPVIIEYTKLAPLDYLEIVLTTVPMDGITLEVSDPEEFFTIDAVSLHPEPEISLSPATHKHFRKWKIQNAILPGQGIVLLWHPKNAETLQKEEHLSTSI